MKKERISYQDHCPELLIQILNEGGTVSDFCQYLGISRCKFYRWTRRYPDFSEALHQGREEARELWLIRCRIPDNNPETGKKYPNTSYHRLLASNIYGKDFLPENKKVSDDVYQVLNMRRLLKTPAVRLLD